VLASVVAIGPLRLTTSRAQAAERQGRAYAFLVACQGYDKKELRPLRFAQNDMTAFAKALIDSGYDKDRMVLMHDGQERRYLPEAAKIKEELTLILDELGPSDTLIVAFSGHGVQHKGDKRVYFCPLDARLEGKTNMIAMDWLYGQMKKCKARLKLLLVDACRNDPRSALGKGRAEVELANLGLAEEPPKGVMAVFSCSEGQESFEDPDLKHGIFFHHVLKGWNGAAANKQGKVTLGELIEYVEESTPKYARLHLKARQKPEHQGEGSGIWVLTQGNAGAWGPVITNSIGMKLVLIPKGKFLMGSPKPEKGRRLYEDQHQVEITRPFYLGQYTVTRGQFRKFVEDTGFKTDAEKNGSGIGYDAATTWTAVKPKYNWRNPGFTQTDQHPVLIVSWNDAMAFCRWLSRKEAKTYRLPTEAEWEYSCRAGTRTRFHCGSDDELGLPLIANVADQSLVGKWYRTGKPQMHTWDDGYPFTAPVGRFRPNKFGLYDMQGNVMQWCSDRYDYNYYAHSPQQDPEGPQSSKYQLRVLRGGSWNKMGNDCRSASRFAGAPTLGNLTNGFRVVCVPHP
jgi:formylglycine-generating enzyme required for sulfatase activity